MRRVVLTALISCVMSASVWASDSKNTVDHPTLVIVDIQEFYFEGGAIPLVGSVEAANSARKLLEYFRAHGWPVIHVQHLPKEVDTPGSDGVPAAYHIRPEVAPASGEPIVGKHHANSFRDTNLQEKLKATGATKLVIVGMQTHMCLEAATRAAADLGYEVTVVGEACATRDLEFDGKTTPASQVHTSTLASLDGAYARVISLDAFLEEKK